MSGATRILAERERQVEEEGFGAAHDDNHDDNELAWAAAAYAAPEVVFRKTEEVGTIILSDVWPVCWDESWDKRPRGKFNLAKRIRALEKAGAFCAAEIDRLLRLEEP